jgi:hypothetical protein
MRGQRTRLSGVAERDLVARMLERDEYGKVGSILPKQRL